MGRAGRKKRAMDEEKSRQAQLWWTFGVALVFAVLALYQASPRVEARYDREPAQLSAPKALPENSVQFR